DGAHAGLSASADGSCLIVQSPPWLYVLRRAGSQWEERSREEHPGLVFARFLAGRETVLVVAVGEGLGGGPEFRVYQRQLGARRSPREYTVVSRFSTGPSAILGPNWYSVYWAADLSADGRWLLFSGREKALHVWDAFAGHPVGSVKLRGVPNQAAISPDGSRFAVDGGTTVYVHDTRSLELLVPWKVKHCYVPKLAWSPDGRLLARADLSSTVRILDVSAGREATAIGMSRQRASAVAFSPDGLTYLAGTFQGAVIVWDMEH